MSLDRLDELAEKYSTGFDDNRDFIKTDIDSLRREYVNGAAVGESCHVLELLDVMSWKRGFQNCWTGFPNSGKTQFTLFMMVLKSMRKGWKWVVWSPEMISSERIDNDVKINMNDMHHLIMWMLTGKTPYKHIQQKYNCDRMSWDEVIAATKWIDDHFTFMNPKEKTADFVYESILNLFKRWQFDGILIDPFKNIRNESSMRDDLYLDMLFDRFKELAVMTDSSMNWIAHPRSGVKQKDESMPCTQYDLLGGAAWDNNMDGIYSIFRPNLTMPDVEFYNLKQRKQELTTQTGYVTDIVLDYKTRRYLFSGSDRFL